MAGKKNLTSKVLTAKELDETLSKVYYAPGGFQGVTALHSRLPKGVASKERIRRWLSSQDVGRYMQTRPPKEVFTHFTEDRPNTIHQADLLFLPHDRVGRKTYKYALTLVDVASRYKAARPLTSKLADEVAKAFVVIYKSGPLTWPKTLMVDDGHEFKGLVSKLMSKNEVRIRRAQPGHHRSQAFVESFNRRLAERLFRKQAQEELDSNRDSRAWVAVLPAVVADMNDTVTRMTGLPPAKAIKMAKVPLLTEKAPLSETLLPIGTMVYVATNEEDPKDVGRRRATDPWWTHKPYPILRRVSEPGQPTLYYTAFSKHGFTRSQLRPVTHQYSHPSSGKSDGSSL